MILGLLNRRVAIHARISIQHISVCRKLLNVAVKHTTIRFNRIFIGKQTNIVPKYDNKYKNTNLHNNADKLSFLSLKPEEIRDDDAIDKFEINTIEALPMMFNYLVAETAEDIELQELF